MSGQLITATGPAQPLAEASGYPSMVPLGPDGAGGGDTEPGVPWGRYVAALLRYKWLIALIIVAGTAIGFGVTKLIKPKYEVRATIWVSSPTPVGQNRGPIQSDELLASTAWSELFRSFLVVDSVVTKRRLYLLPNSAGDSVAFTQLSLGDGYKPGNYDLTVDATGQRYSLETSTGELLEAGSVGDSIGRSIGLLWQPAGATLGRDRTIGFEVIHPREASGALNDALTAMLPEKSNFMRLSLAGQAPTSMARTMNVWLLQFVNVAKDLKARNAVEFSRILEGQLSYAKTNLANAERSLESFRVQTITEPSEGTSVAPGLLVTQDPLTKGFLALRGEYDSARRDREALEAIIARSAGGPISPDAISAVPTLLAPPSGDQLAGAVKELYAKQAELRNARQIYTDEYKKVKDLDAAVTVLQAQTIPMFASALLSELRQREAELQRRISAQSVEMIKIPARSIEEMRLKRNVDVAQALYLSLQSKYSEAKLAEASTISDVRILDSAVAPQRPTLNTKPRILLMAFAASAGLALALAILLDQIDRRFRYPEQVTRDMGLAILGAVPTIRKRLDRDIDHEEAAQVVEAFRAIRLNLLHAYPPGGPVLLTVSSAGIGDGKSTIASNLALSFAESGLRTLLIDGDTRRGEQHLMFAVPQRPGLLDYLANGTAVDEILRPTARERLTILPCGSRLRRGPELLQGARMGALVGDLKSRFEVIVVDSPPLGAGIDPYALSTVTGNLLLVFRAGQTDRKMAEAKLALLDRLPVRLLGAVLNGVKTSGMYQYYTYLYGYTVTEDDALQLPAGAGEVSGRT
jgi:succinoglycan biosynthesis transport protein ExoP